MTKLKLSEAKAHLGHYAREAAAGKSFIISAHHRPVALLGPLDQNDSRGVRPKLGLLSHAGITTPEDFDAPCEEIEKLFYGE